VAQSVGPEFKPSSPSTEKKNANQNIFKKHKQQMLARMWQNRNPYVLLVGMQISATIMESSMESS
jgi:hypothetical protein